jgi:hypothetical protein
VAFVESIVNILMINYLGKGVFKFRSNLFTSDNFLGAQTLP